MSKPIVPSVDPVHQGRLPSISELFWKCTRTYVTLCGRCHKTGTKRSLTNTCDCLNCDSRVWTLIDVYLNQAMRDKTTPAPQYRALYYCAKRHAIYALERAQLLFDGLLSCPNITHDMVSQCCSVPPRHSRIGMTSVLRHTYMATSPDPHHSAFDSQHYSIALRSKLKHVQKVV